MFCKNCGAAIEEGQTSCPVCKTAVSLFNGNVGVAEWIRKQIGKLKRK